MRIVHEPGTDLARARRAAREADAVVVVVGLDHLDEGESNPQLPEGDRGGDRRSLVLHSDEQQLVKAAAAENKKVVVVLVGGSAITMEEWKRDVPAILMAWYPGMEGGHALARILFGDVNPSGKLTITVPGDPSVAAAIRPRGPKRRVRLLPRLHLGRQEGHRACVRIRVRLELHEVLAIRGCASLRRPSPRTAPWTCR